MKPWLSILIPVYNVELFLRECLDSVVTQAEQGIEILVVDDASTDNSFNMLTDYCDQSRHPITVLKHPQNAGLSAARNTLINAAQGNYLWFLDSDDVLAPGALAQLKQAVAIHKTDLIICDYEIWRNPPNRKKHKRKKEAHVASFSGAAYTAGSNSDALFEGLYKEGKLHSWAIISKRELWSDNLRFPEGKYFEDMYTTPALAARARTFVYWPEVWIKYRQRSGSIVATPNLEKISDMVGGLTNVLSIWSQHHPQLSSRGRFYFLQYCIKIYLFARKDLSRLGITGDTADLRQRIYESAQTSARKFAFEFIMRGKWLRLAKFYR